MEPCNFIVMKARTYKENSHLEKLTQYKAKVYCLDLKEKHWICNPNFFFLSNKKKFLWILGGSTFWTAWTWDWAADQYSVHQSENSLVECDGRLKIVNRELYCKHFWVALKMAKTLFNERIESCGISSSWYQKVDVSRTATRKCG